jgi:hypothetical protein
MSIHRFLILFDQLCMSVPACAEGMSGSKEGLAFDNAEVYIWRALVANRNGELKSWAHYEDPGDARRVWIVVDTIASATRKKLDLYYDGDIYRAFYKEEMEKEALELVEPSDTVFFSETGQYKSEQIAQMTQACGWLRLVSEKEWYVPFAILQAREAFDIAASILSKKKLFGLQISNGRSLRNKAMQWNKVGRECVLSGRMGNGNGVKGGDNRDTIISRMVDLYSSPLKPTFDKVAEIINREAVEQGWIDKDGEAVQMTRQRIQQILEQPEYKVQWAESRHGKVKARELMENILSGKPLEYADEVWSLDGTTVQIYMDDNGKLNKPMYRVTMTDGFSSAIIAEAFGETENGDVVLEVIRLAIAYAGNVPRRIQYDGAIARMKKVQVVLAKLSMMGIRAQPYNGKSKYVESVLGKKEQSVMRFFGNFVGGNVTGKSLEAKANPDAIKRLHKQKGLPDSVRGVVFQDLLATIVYNNKTIKKYGKTPLEMYEIPDNRRRKVDLYNLAYAFWQEKQRTVEYTTKGLDLTFGESREFYLVEESRGLESQEFRTKWLGAKFKIRYDEYNLDKVMLFDLEDRYVAVANRKYEFDRVAGGGEEGTMSLLYKALEQRANFFELGAEKRAAHREKMEAIGLGQLDFVLAHKDELNRAGVLEEVSLVLNNGIALPSKNSKKENMRLGKAKKDYTEYEDAGQESIYEAVDSEYIKSLLQ